MNYSFINIYGVIVFIGLVAIIFFVRKLLKGRVIKPRKSKVLTETATKKEAEPISEEKHEEGRYKSLTWDINGLHHQRLAKPLGRVWYKQPSMSESGQSYFVEKHEGKEAQAFDPREIPLVPGETPQDLFDAIEWKGVVNGVYAIPSSLWDKINMLLPYVAAFLFFIVMLVGLDKLHK